MKKTLVFALILAVQSVFSQNDGTWAFGLQCGLQANSSEFTGGSETAHGLFEQNSFGSTSFQGTARYDLNSRWMFTTGFGFITYGFDFSRKMERYSLSHLDDDRYSTISNEFGAVEIPMMAFYKFRLNCRNARWLIGAGFASLLTGQQQNSQTFIEDEEGNISMQRYLKSDATAQGGIFTMLRFAISRERILKKGGIVQVALLFNAGLRTLANATVAYDVDGEEFSHTFSNSGNFVGLRASYYFRSRQKN